MASIVTNNDTKLKNNYDAYEISSWEDENLNLNNQVLRGIYSFGFEKPSSIQKKALYPMTKNIHDGRRRDITAQAQSGTGKTGAFVIAALNILKENISGPQVLILAPTHELADQILDVVENLSRYLKDVNSLLLVGGTSVDKNKKFLHTKKPKIVVGTPGRVNDLIRRKFLITNSLSLLVLDEADEMLSSGFKEQMYKIFKAMPNNVQIALFSATMPKDLHELTESFMKNPTKILVKNDELTLQGIAQYYINLEDDTHKYETIKDIFSGLTISQAIIYCNSVSRVNDLEEAMITDNFPVKKIHGKMTDVERKYVYKEFKAGGCRVLITSDLFARGIDVQQVSIVINFDIPRDENTYLHRIGRSGRWGRKGIAINFQTKYDMNRLSRFEKFYETEIREMPIDFTNHLNL
jgi:translation initiation factor 4A